MRSDSHTLKEKKRQGLSGCVLQVGTGVWTLQGWGEGKEREGEEMMEEK